MNKATFVVLDIETVPDRARWTSADPAAFPPAWAHRIVCVGWLVLDELCSPIANGTITGPEPEILARLSRRLSSKPTLVTYNGRTFDLPVIMLRSLAHRIAQPWFFSDRDYRYRYSERMHVDLCDILTEHGALKSMPLDALAKLVGLSGKQGVDGSNVEQMFEAGRIDDIARYCLDDVRQTAMLFLNTWLLRGNMEAAELELRLAAVDSHFAAKAAAA